MRRLSPPSAVARVKWRRHFTLRIPMWPLSRRDPCARVGAAWSHGPEGAESRTRGCNCYHAFRSRSADPMRAGPPCPLYALSRAGLVERVPGWLAGQPGARGLPRGPRSRGPFRPPRFFCVRSVSSCPPSPWRGPRRRVTTVPGRTEAVGPGDPPTYRASCGGWLGELPCGPALFQLPAAGWACAARKCKAGSVTHRGATPA